MFLHSAILLIVGVQLSYAIIAYDCSSPDTQFYPISLVTTPNCTLKVTSCFLTYNIIAEHCGSWFRYSLMATKYQHIVMLTPEQCKRVHEQQLYMDPAFPNVKIYIRDNQGTFVGGIVGSNKDGKCSGGVFHSHRPEIGVLEDVFVHLEASIRLDSHEATLNLKEKRLTFNSGYSAAFEPGNAFDSVSGQNFWSTEILEDDCKNNKIFVVYEGIVNKIIETFGDSGKNRTIYFLSDEAEQRDFLLEAVAPIQLCNELAYTTQALALFVVESSNGVFANKREKNVNPLNFGENLFMSMKISHLSYNVGIQLSELYRDLMYQMCLSEAKIIKNALTLAISNPQEFSFNYFSASGMHAFVRSDVIFVGHCAPVNVSFRHDNKKCTQELPVEYLGKELYLHSRSRILVDKAEVVPCSNISPNMYKIDNLWYNKIGGHLVLAKKPEEISVKLQSNWSYRPLTSLASAGIYSKENVEAYHKVISNNINLQSQAANFFNDITTAGGYAITNAFSLTDFERLKESLKTTIWQKATQWAKDLGSFTSFLIGMMLVVKTIQFVVNTIINGVILSYSFGFNYRLLFACWNNCVNLALHSDNIQDKKRERKAKKSNQESSSRSSSLTNA